MAYAGLMYNAAFFAETRVRGRPGGEIGATATFIFIQPRCCVKWCLIHTWHEMRVNSSDMFASKAL
jgi:hypothetical protein